MKLLFVIFFLVVSCQEAKIRFLHSAPPIAKDFSEVAFENLEQILFLTYLDPKSNQAIKCNLSELVNLTVTKPCTCLFGVCTVGVTGKPNYKGEASLYYSVTTKTGISNLAKANITVLNVADSPIVLNFLPPSLSEDTETLISLNYSDADGDLATSCQITNLDSLFVTAPCACSNGLCHVGVKGVLNYYGGASFQFSVITNGESSNSATAIITILPIPDLPITSDLAYAPLQEDLESLISLPYFDGDGDLATYCSIYNLSNVFISKICTCSAGVCTVGITGTTNYDGPGSFSYTVTAGGDLSNLAKVTFTIDSVQDFPVVTNFSPASFQEDIESIIILPYTDGDGDMATSCNVSALANITATTPCSCSLGVCTVGVTGTANYFGNASFDFSVTAGGHESNIASALLLLTPVEDPPLAYNLSPVAFDEDVQSTIILSYIDNDGDLANDCNVINLLNVTVTSSCSCSSGVCSVGVTGALNYYGPASFNYTVTTNGQTSNSADVDLIINSIPDAPVASNINPPAFNEDSSSQIILKYTDAEGDLATSCSISDLANVSVSTACSCSAGVCTVGVMGSPDFFGAANFNYTITANGLTSNLASVNVTILPVPDLSIISPTSGTSKRAHLWSFSGTCEDSYPVVIEYDSASTGPSSVVCSGGAFTAQINFTSPGSRSVIVKQTAENNTTSISRSVTFNGAVEVAMGGYQTCTRFADKTIQCWGDNLFGGVGDGTTIPRYTPVVVSGLSNVEKLSLGADHSCALLSNKSIKCWGYNSVGSLGNGTTTNSSVPVNVSSISNAIEIGTGKSHSCALRDNGTVSCWGDNVSGQLGDGTTTNRTSPVAVSGLTNVNQIALGYLHSCALLNTGSVRCWGYNIDGQLGNGNNTNQNSAVTVSGITNAIAVATGHYHSCALLSDMTVKCWGRNTEGALGNGNLNNSNTPVSVSNINDSIAILNGSDYSCSLNSFGTVQCWGSNSSGTIGNRNTVSSVVTTPIVTRTNVVSLPRIAHLDHICANFNDGSIKCWGKNDNGQLGNNLLNVSFPEPVQLPLNSLQNIYSGFHNRQIVQGTNGAFFGWGRNISGELGDGTTFSYSSPRELTNISGFDSIKGGTSSTCGAMGSVIKCFGFNGTGQLGDGTFSSSTVPVTVSGITSPIGYAVGEFHACAILSNTTARCWGFNDSRQLGNNSTTSSPTPVTVGGSLTNIKELALGRQHSCALLHDGTGRCWGKGTFGRLGRGSNSDATTPVAILGLTTGLSIASGPYHGCVILSDKTVRCWGSNFYGQVGNGSNTDQNSPQVVSGLTNVASLALGGTSSCALISNGTVKCWGHNLVGQLGNGTYVNSNTPVTVLGITNAVKISSGNQHACALLADSTMKCWGINRDGNIGLGTYGDTYELSTPIFIE